MFQLDNAIENWKSGLLSNQNLTDSNVDELQGHLRDEIDNLMLAGLNEEEAFMVSSHRMGDQQAVGAEFAKVNPSLAWRRRAFWMFLGIQVSMLVSGIASLCETASSALLTWFNVDAAISGVVSALIHIGVFVVILVGVISGLNLFARTMRRKLSVSMTLILCMLSIILLKAGSYALRVIQVHYVASETFGKMAMASAYVNFAWAILWPMIVITMLFVLWPSRPLRVR